MQKYETSAMARSPITAEPIDIPAIAPEERGVDAWALLREGSETVEFMVLDEVGVDDVRSTDVVVTVTMPVMPVIVLGAMLTVDEERVLLVEPAAVMVESAS